MSLVTVEVTQDCIAKGEPDCGETCAVALALANAFGTPDVTVDGVDMVVGDLVVDTPDEIEAFIGVFDARKPVKPFRFVIDTEKEEVVAGSIAPLGADR